MGNGIEQHATIGMYNVGERRRSRTTFMCCHKTSLTSLIDIPVQFAHVYAAFADPDTMGTDIAQRSAATGSKDDRITCSRSKLLFYSTILSNLKYLFVRCSASLITALMLLILLSGDVERNPGPDIDGEFLR